MKLREEIQPTLNGHQVKIEVLSHALIIFDHKQKSYSRLVFYRVGLLCYGGSAEGQKY